MEGREKGRRVSDYIRFLSLFQFFSILIKRGLISFTLTPNVRLDNSRRNLLRYITAERLIKNGEMNDLCDAYQTSCRTASFVCNFED